MRRLICAVVAGLLAASAALAADSGAERLAVKGQLGVAMNTGVAPAYSYLNTAGLVSVDLQYRMSRHVALVPASVSFYFYSGGAAGGGQGYPGSYQYQGRTRSSSLNYVEPGIWSPFGYPDYYYGGGYYRYGGNSVPSLAWAISMTPGIKFQTAGRDLFNLYAQFGAGLYHHNQNASDYYGVGSLNRTSPAVRAETGVEIIVEKNINLLLGGGYMWVGNNPAYNGLVNLNMGVRLGF